MYASSLSPALVYVILVNLLLTLGNVVNMFINFLVLIDVLNF